MTINADGDGNTPNGAFVYFQPMGTTTVTDNNENVSNLLIVVNNLNPNNVIGPVAVASSGGMLNAHANGANAAVIAQGYPLAFTGGATTLQSKGTGFNHLVYVENNGQTSGTQGLTFSGGAVILDASAATGGDGGEVRFIGVDKATLSSPSFVFNTNGPATGNGNAGRVDLGGVKSMVLSSSSTATITANAATAGTGGPNLNGYQAINLSPGANNITLGTGAGKYSLSARGGNQGGDGGYVNVYVPVPQTITLDSGVDIDTSAGSGAGKGGIIYLNCKSFAVTGTSAQINSNGGTTSGNGGDVTLTGNGTLKLGTGAGSLKISSTSAGTMNTISNHPGNVTVTYTDTLTADGSGIVLTTGGDATGGQINLTNLGKLTVTGTLAANSSGQGPGATPNGIVLQSSSYNTMTLDNATISSSAAAAGSGTGGTIAISNAGPISLNGTVLHADASNAGTGNGGYVDVEVTGTGTTPLDVNSAQITTVGAANGPGGRVKLNSVSIFSVNQVIQATLGSAVTSQSTFGGSVSLNGVTCQKWLTPSSITWPKSYWNCVNPTSPSATDQITTTALNQYVLPSTPVNLATQLNNVQATIYVQTDVSQFAKFFGATLNVTTAGYSFKETPGTTFDVTLFENATQPWGGTIALSASDLTSTTIHELGHAIDFSYGVESSMQIYGTYISDDLDYLDTAGGGTPCAAGAGHAQGPFVGVIDTQTGQQMCTGTTLNNPNGIYSDPNNPGHFFSNSVIAQVSSHALDAGYINGINGWVEPYAETFAYSGYNSTLANPGGYNFASLTADGLFHKGYYQCAMTRAAALTGKAYAPTFNYSCN